MPGENVERAEAAETGHRRRVQAGVSGRRDQAPRHPGQPGTLEGSQGCMPFGLPLCRLMSIYGDLLWLALFCFNTHEHTVPAHYMMPCHVLFT